MNERWLENLFGRGRRRRIVCQLVVLLLSIHCWLDPAHAITIRHDVNDSEYISLAAQPRYESALAISYYANSNPSNVFWCTGTLIHPEWVLTASHCTVSSTAWTATAFRGADRSNPTATIPVDIKIPNASFNISDVTLGNDFGLMHLTTPVLDATPARIYRSTGELGSTATVLGYGRTGTGVTGEDATLPNGIRRAMQNTVDAFGGLFGWSPKLMVVDFDNPSNPADNLIGSAVPLPLEGAVALNDSGGGWFQEIGGISYLTGVTSFRASADGNSNSDYGDLSIAGRVSQDLAWIDDRYDRTLFWNGSTGNWNQAAAWYGGIEPTAASAAVVDAGTASVTSPGETAKYVFLQGTGRLILNQNLQTDHFRMRSGGRLELGGPAVTALISGDFHQEAGTLQLDIHGNAPGQFDQLQIGGDAVVQGSIDIQSSASYIGPAGPGGIDQFLLLTANSLNASPQSVKYDDVSLTELTSTYLGTTQSGADGFFAWYERTGGGIELSTYLAIPGDANGDGVVDGSDFGVWNAHKFTTGNTWQTGDFNGDGVVDGSDFGIWNANKFTSVAMRPVPEPTGMISSLLITLFVFRKRKLAGLIIERSGYSSRIVGLQKGGQQDLRR